MAAGGATAANAGDDMPDMTIDQRHVARKAAPEDFRDPSEMKSMNRIEPLRDDVAVGDLSAAAKLCTDAKLRGVILALASLHEGVGLRDAARIWGVDPVILRHAQRRFEEGGLEGLLNGTAAAEKPSGGSAPTDPDDATRRSSPDEREGVIRPALGLGSKRE